MNPAPRQPHLLLLLLASFLLFTSSYPVDLAFRWTDPVEGMICGIVHVIICGPVWLFFGLPFGIMIHLMCRSLGWHRIRTLGILMPGIAAHVWVIACLLLFPTTPAGRFRESTGTDLPASIRELRADLSGGSGLSDPEYIFYFRCRPEDTEELIRTLRLAPAPFDEDLLTAPVDKSWPDPATWPGSRIYRGGPEDGSWWYYLRTDATREQVYFLSGHS
jgi:hypothetical protein